MESEKKVLEKLEAEKTTELKKWIESNFHKNGPGEVKVERGKKFYYSSGSFPKEFVNLMKSTMCTVSYKNPDTGWGTPYDLTIYSKAEAYLFIFFGDVKKFYVINILKINDEIERGENGLTEERAKELADVVDYIK